MSPLRAIIFDLDDTLYLERDFAFSGFAAVAEAFADLLGDPATATDQMRRLFDGPQRARVFNALLAERGLPADAGRIAAMIDVYRNHRPTLSLLPDAERLLARAAAAGLRTGLITDGPPRTQWNKIDALGLRERLDETVVTSELGPDAGKPSPLVFEEITRRLGVRHEECLYVADNPAKDFVAANALSWRTVQVRRAQGVYRDTPAAPGGAAGQVVETLDELRI